MPEHLRDNYKDPSVPGPESWKLRPAEVSRAIDADLLGDPPGFDRAVLPEVDRKITSFFRKHLLP